LTAGYDELIAAGTSTRDAADLIGLSRATQGRGAHPGLAQPQVESDAVMPVNKLTEEEERVVLAVLHSERFVDKPPAQIYATLLAEGTYLCSISTMYRILTKNAQVKDRRRQASHPPRAVPELQATAPRQVYSWDTTKLKGPVRGKYFDCYVMIDIYSSVASHAASGRSSFRAGGNPGPTSHAWPDSVKVPLLINVFMRSTNRSMRRSSAVSKLAVRSPLGPAAA
jgi:hypothetical protein